MIKTPMDKEDDVRDRGHATLAFSVSVRRFPALFDLGGLYFGESVWIVWLGWGGPSG